MEVMKLRLFIIWTVSTPLSNNSSVIAINPLLQVTVIHPLVNKTVNTRWKYKCCGQNNLSHCYICTVWCWLNMYRRQNFLLAILILSTVYSAFYKNFVMVDIWWRERVKSLADKCNLISKIVFWPEPGLVSGTQTLTFNNIFMWKHIPF